eukprot:843967-Rhodomonas_salina.3
MAATDVFAAFHAGTSYSFLPEFEIGVLDVENTSKELVVSEKQVGEPLAVITSGLTSNTASFQHDFSRATHPFLLR